jgi:hypothetical protein
MIPGPDSSQDGPGIGPDQLMGNRETAQEKKDKIIAALVEARRSILDEAAALPPKRQDEVFLGTWSIKDLLAHLVGWDYTNIEATSELLSGKLPSFYKYRDPDWRTYNARLVAQYKCDDFSELLSSIEESHRKLIAFLQAVPAEEFEKDQRVHFKGYKVTIARLLEGEATDERLHHEQICVMRNE